MVIAVNASILNFALVIVISRYEEIRRMNTGQLPIDKQPDFLLTIHFPAGVKDPQRIFFFFLECITALQACDQMLLKSFPTAIQPVFVLEQVETGSLKMWLRQLLEAVDDAAIKNLDWKPAVGTYLVKGKHLLLKKLGGEKGLPSKHDLSELSDKLQELAKETDVLMLPSYSRVSEIDIAEHAGIISAALARLEPGESISLNDDEGEAVIDAGFAVTDEDIKNLLIERTLENTSELILMVRKPDFLGETKWEFRFNRRSLSVAIVDKNWLSNFQSGKVDIRPGDALHVTMKERVSYDGHGEVVSEEREILVVLGVIRKKEQHSLLG